VYTVHIFIQPFTENLFRKIAHNRKTQKGNSAILREIKFANDLKVKNVHFLSQKFHKSFANGNLITKDGLKKGTGYIHRE